MNNAHGNTLSTLSNYAAYAAGLLGLCCVQLSQAAAPVITSTPTLTATVGTTYTYQLQASDADNDPLIYQVGSWPSGLDLSVSESGVISWDIDERSDAGKYMIFASVYDADLNEDKQRYSLIVTDPTNQAPVINGAPVVQANTGAVYTYDLQATDADNDSLSYHVSSWPSGADITVSDQGIITWDLDDRSHAGKYVIFVRVEDAYLGVENLRYNLTVTDPTNQDPVINNPPVLEASTGSIYTYDLQATDADNDLLSYSVSSWPSGADITVSDQGIITWDLDDRSDAGQYVIYVRVDDGHLGVDYLRYPLSVIDANNHIPVINNPPILTASTGSVYTYDLQATDADNDPLSYDVSTWPSGLDVEVSDQGVITWDLNDPNDAGKYVIFVRVNDGNQGIEYLRYDLSVTNPNNRTPVINNAPVQEAVTGSVYTYDLQATDADNDPLTYQVSSWPSSLNVIISDQGVITWDIDSEQEPGRFVIYARVDDGNQGIENLRYQITVVEPDIESDTDGDGIADVDDAFPNDPLQSQDSNGDGIGDNIATSQAVSYTYNDQGQILTINGSRTDVDDITTYTYDSNGNRTHITNALGHQTILSEHNGRGQPQQITSVNGTQTSLTYHVRGWLLSATVIHPTFTGSDSTTAYEYDNTGNITKIIRPDNVELIYHYDTSNRLVAVSNNAGERIDYVLDNAGNRLSQTIQDGSATITYRLQQAYDELSRVMEIVGADDQTTQIDYDVNSNPVETINPRNFASQNIYDPLNRLTQTTDADGGTTQFSYDKQDRLTSVTDANGNITSYEYDAFDNLIEQNSPDTGISRHAYDNAGNRLISVDSRGIVTRYTYDVLNRLTHINYPLAPEENVVYAYDADAFDDSTGRTIELNAKGRLHHIQDQSGQTYYSYDHRGNVQYHIRTIGHNENSPVYWTDYRYDQGNKLIDIQMFSELNEEGDNLNYSAGYQYDAVGRVAGVTYQRANGLSSQPLIENLTYLPFGPVTQVDYGNGSSTQMAYDQDYRLVEQQTQTDNSTLIDRSYSYDPNGNIVRIDNLAQDPYNQQLEYDPIDRLASITKERDSGESDSRIRAYGHDLVGNRLTSTFSQGDMGYSDDYGYLLGSNILADILRTGATPQSTTYTLDDIGNTTAMNKASGNIQFTYNAANRPIKVLSNGVETHYGYNALGQRTSKTQQGETTHYIYTLRGQLMGEYRSDGQPIVEYIYWNNQPLAQIRNKVAYYYHNDHLGTPTALTNAAQETVWQADYEAFGEATLTEESVGNNLRFAGQYFDGETGLHYNWFRYYDPSTGRYTQSDPIGLGGGINTYSYALNNPLMYIDPTGKISIAEGIVIAVVAYSLYEFSESLDSLKETVEANKDAYYDIENPEGRLDAVNNISKAAVEAAKAGCIPGVPCGGLPIPDIPSIVTTELIDILNNDSSDSEKPPEDCP